MLTERHTEVAGVKEITKELLSSRQVPHRTTVAPPPSSDDGRTTPTSQASVETLTRVEDLTTTSWQETVS